MSLKYILMIFKACCIQCNTLFYLLSIYLSNVLNNVTPSINFNFRIMNPKFKDANEALFSLEAICKMAETMNEIYEQSPKGTGERLG